MTDWSIINVEQVKGRSRLVSCKSVQPLKILNPGSYRHSCHVVLSTYGGGVVNGDKINLRVKCGVGSTMFLNTQSNTKIFKALNSDHAVQLIESELEDNAVAVVFPDPVVLQKNSRFKQKQHWKLGKNSVLFLVDWFHAGRTDMGERFEFGSYTSEIKIFDDENVILTDRFSFDPEKSNPVSPANFQDYQSFLSAYLVGPTENNVFKIFEEALLRLKEQQAIPFNADITARGCIISVTQAREGVYMIRASAKSRIDLKALVDLFSELLAHPDVLNYDPIQRKY